MTNFAEDVIAGVTGHMNGDHAEDNLLIARAFGYPEATGSTMVGVTGEAGVWRVTDAAGDHELTVPWPNAPLTERPEIRKAVVLVYRAACKTLGVEARQEHEGEIASSHGVDDAQAGHGHGGHGHGAHGGHGHGHGAHGGHGGGNPHASTEEYAEGEKPFSVVVRESSWGDHSDSEGATFMEDIMRGKATKQDYIDLSAQHYFMYEALEAATAQYADNATMASFHRSELERLETLKVDLEHLLGADWADKIAPVPATAAYAARIREVAAEGWVAGIVAHHYTRYLGDLSGGQIIARRVSKQHGLEKAGVSFYDFTALGALDEFKNEYRGALDALGATLAADEQQRMLDEVRAAYGFNTAVFVDLGKAKAAANA
ncbi:biliverdin-producing heme oxygenase [Leucobacter sp. HY1910]